MSDNTTVEVENTPEDNELIRDLRRQLKESKQATKTAGDDAVALVKRGATATGLMPEGFKGLADIYAAEVDGELDVESATTWLAGRGFGATAPENSEVEVVDTATQLEAVTDLGSAVVAAGNTSPQDAVTKQLEDVVDPNSYQSLEDVTAAVAAILEG